MKDIKASHIMEFHMICDDLNKLIRKINCYCPDAEYYLSANAFHLLNGSSHEDVGGGHCTAHRERIVASDRIRRCTGGDW